ncbi:Uncharacterized protein FWK35_00000113 [Aphis craccivora]|uniref:Uncharacterized protein n=1 Tax=Aphis craccivora TaxID=307492 RepID=A0A6G0ZQC3_APHCR|nr:Uncharacterized protein FWK35_00000113 [Aphis craccivora]
MVAAAVDLNSSALVSDMSTRRRCWSSSISFDSWPVLVASSRCLLRTTRTTSSEERPLLSFSPLATPETQTICT